MPEITLTAHEAFERSVLSHVIRPAERDSTAASSDDDAARVSNALMAALCVSIKASANALEDVSRTITHVATSRLYKRLQHKGETTVDMAASILGVPELEPVEPELVE